MIKVGNRRPKAILWKSLNMEFYICDLSALLSFSSDHDFVITKKYFSLTKIRVKIEFENSGTQIYMEYNGIQEQAGAVVQNKVRVLQKPPRGL